MKKLLMMALFAGVPFAYQTSVPSSPVEPDAFGNPAAMDAVIEEAIRDGQIPGAVVVVGHRGRVVFQKAYGSRALEPRREPMTLDTIFDVASLTKVVATTSAIAKLVEEGKIRLNERVTAYLPEFQGGKSDITVRNLLTHYSGMRPDINLEPEWRGYDTGIKLAVNDKPDGPPNIKFTYSDINFELLGEIVHRMSQKTLPEYVTEKVFAPLGMSETMYQPPTRLIPRIAPTEIIKGSTEPLRGVVHDPTARFMGGVAGHAGLFSTAADLTKFAEMLLGEGQRNGVRVFSPLTVRKFTTPQSPSDQPAVRGLGWDIDSPQSNVRGDLFPVGSYGHTGFTGTSLWIDPSTNAFVILLSNSVHPHLKATITPLRAKVASVAAAGLDLSLAPAQAAALPSAAKSRVGSVLTGIDLLAESSFAELAGKRVGLITNHTGLTRDGKRNIDVMLAGGVNLKALYSPEHGIAGKEDQENVDNSKDAATGLPVWSLYSGQKRRPGEEMLRDIDTLVFDIQDIGARFYTYACTMSNAMQEAAKRNIEFVVLDRPNPINGIKVEGPMLDPSLKSFIGCFELPIRHGMTMGELAQMMNARNEPKAKLRVIRMKGWQRTDWFDDTGLPWVNPSPNMRSLNAAILYPGIGMLEGGKQYSVGRGTDAPFEQIGAEWLKGQVLAEELNRRNLPGIRVYPVRLQPTASNFAGQAIEGVRFVLTDRNAFNSVRFGLEVGSAIAKLFPSRMNWAADEKLVGDRKVLQALERAADPASIEQGYAIELGKFLKRRSEFLLY